MNFTASWHILSATFYSTNPEMKKSKWLLHHHLFSYQNLLQIVDDKSTKLEHSKKIHFVSQNPATDEVEVIGKSTAPNCRQKQSNRPNPNETPLLPTQETVIHRAVLALFMALGLIAQETVWRWRERRESWG